MSSSKHGWGWKETLALSSLLVAIMTFIMPEIRCAMGLQSEACPSGTSNGDLSASEPEQDSKLEHIPGPEPLVSDSNSKTLELELTPEPDLLPESQLEQFPEPDLNPESISTDRSTRSTPPAREFNRLWISETGKTKLPGLDSICYGNTVIGPAETVFGYDKPPFYGTINIVMPEEHGCSRRSVFQGSFTLSGDAGSCIGDIVVSSESSDHFHINWSIKNLGSSCPVETKDWQVSVYPEVK